MMKFDGLLLPHSRISATTRIRVERRLPRPGKILVQKNQQVEAQRRVAQATSHGEMHVVNVTRALGLRNSDLSQVMVKKRGDRVEAGETIAARRGILPFLHKPCRSPADGRLAAIGHGWAVIEAESESVDLTAFIPGQVVAVNGDLSVTIETTGAQVVGACGVGGEAHGVLQVLVEDPRETITPHGIDMGCNNAILVVGAHLSPETLDRAREMKVAGVVVGSISASLCELDPPPFPVVATEGYGEIPMSPDAFRVLKEVEGHQACISGGMGQPWNPSRPTVVVSLEDVLQDADQIPEGKAHLSRKFMFDGVARVGDRLRGVRHPLQGRAGQILSLQEENHQMPSGIVLSTVQIDFDGESRFVPWLNLEQIG